MAMVSAAAAAQTTAIDPHAGAPMFYNTPDSRQRGALLLRHMGSCVYGKERVAARSLLRAIPGSKDEERRLAALHSRLEECVNGDSEAIQSTNFVLRGAVAEAIYLATFPTDPVAVPAGADPSGLPASWIEAFGKDPSIGPRLAMHQLASCVVRAAPAESSRLVRSAPGSAEEAAGFQAVAPNLGPCVNQGRTFSSNRTTLRALLAEALYDRFIGVDDHPATAH